MSLHPEIKAALEGLPAAGWQDIATLSPQAAREQSWRFAQMRRFPVSLPPINSRDVQLSVSGGDSILLRLYQPEETHSTAAIIYYHGGGYVVGSVEQYDPVCRWIAAKLSVPVISVDYRLAPEYPFPIQIEDGYAALEWIVNNAHALGIQDRHMIVSGDSAGAHLATMMCILSRDRKGPKIAGQWLLYPWVDDDLNRTSYAMYSEGFVLKKSSMEWYIKQYLTGDAKANYPAFPMQITNLKNLPAAFVVVAECDVLYDEAQAYIQKLRAAGNTVHDCVAEGMIHGFLTLYPVPACFATAEKIFAQMKTYMQEMV